MSSGRIASFEDSEKTTVGKVVVDVGLVEGGARLGLWDGRWMGEVGGFGCQLWAGRRGHGDGNWACGGGWGR